MWLIEFLILVASSCAVIAIVYRVFDENAREDGVQRGDDWVFRGVRRIRVSLLMALALSAGSLWEGLNRENDEKPHVVLLGLYAAGACASILAWPPSIILTPRGVVKKRWGFKGPTLPYRMISTFREDERGGILIESVTGRELRVSPRQAGLSQMLFLLRKRTKRGSGA